VSTLARGFLVVVFVVVHARKTCKRGELGVGVENEAHAANVDDAESVYGLRASEQQ